MKEPTYHTRSILRKVLPKYCQGRVLDVGAGRGKYKKLIMNYAQNYLAVDNTSSADQFKDNQALQGIDIFCDVTDIPLPDCSFDTEICTEVIEHVPDPLKLMKELSRLLKKRGYLILSSGWLAPYHPEPKDYYRFSPDAYLYLCQQNNLRVVEIIPKGRFFVVYLHLFLRTIDLHGRLSKKILLKLKPLVTCLESFCCWLDALIKSQDSIGHLIIAQKQ